jgi:hypothetical protein
VKIIDSVFHVIPQRLVLLIGRNILLKLLELFEGSSVETKVFFLWIVSPSSIRKAKE